MAEQSRITIVVIGVDIGKNSFHVVALDRRGAIALRQKWSRGQVASRLAAASHPATPPPRPGGGRIAVDARAALR
jgi:hypothetical protein